MGECVDEDVVGRKKYCRHHVRHGQVYKKIVDWNPDKKKNVLIAIDCCRPRIGTVLIHELLMYRTLDDSNYSFYDELNYNVG